MDKQEQKEVKKSKVATEIMEKRKPSSISVCEFVSKYKSYKSDTAKAEYLKNTIKAISYLPYTVKCSLMKAISDVCNTTQSGLVNVDSIKEFPMFMITMLDSYTNLLFDKEHPLVDFESLEELDLIDTLVKYIPEKEYTACRTILARYKDDFLTNNSGIAPFLQKLVEMASTSFSSMIEKIQGQFGDMTKEDLIKLLNTK